MRLMCMMALITAIILSGLVVAQSLQQSARGGVYQPRDPEVLYIIFGFLIAAFAPKAVQKFAEQKLPAYDPTLVARQAPPVYAGYLPPAPAVAPPAPVAPVAQVAPVAPAVVSAPAPAAASAPPVTPVVPSALQNVLQRGAL
jgi:hypothetical protein